MEYMTHVLDLMSRTEHANAQRLQLPADAPLSPAIFNFRLEDRIQCHTSGCVSYRCVVPAHGGAGAGAAYGHVF
jgi:hypothetical protein